MTHLKNVSGYLPDENPPLGKLLLFALQQIVVMFPATVIVALLTGFHISTTLFASGLATLCFIVVTKGKIPLYYGSSFAYLSAIVSVTGFKYAANSIATSPDEMIQIAQFGIVMSGFVSIIAGFIINRFGKDTIDKILPATITGSVAMIIGLTLAENAILDAAPFMEGMNNNPDTQLVWIVSLVTLLSTIFFSVYIKRGVLSQIPILLGLTAGYITAIIVQQATGIQFIHFDVLTGAIVQAPHFTLPKVSWPALFAIMPIAIATIPESTAHIYQLDIYVNQLAKDKKTGKIYKLKEKLGLNLIGDGIGDIVSGMIGGPAGTNYGENISTMAISKNFSIGVLVAAAVITMFISFFTPLINLIYSIPKPVIGGLEIYLFGVIAAQGIAILMDRKVDMFDSKNLAVIAVILIVGLGGNSAFGGMIPFFGLQLPTIATAAISGIGLNLLLNFGRKQKDTSEDMS
ncbi:MAG: xanthine permease [Erysipelothrix sp.]|nr:xanthine permease [Erysipelothrix sp.]